MMYIVLLLIDNSMSVTNNFDLNYNHTCCKLEVEELHKFDWQKSIKESSHVHTKINQASSLVVCQLFMTQINTIFSDKYLLSTIWFEDLT